MKYTKGEWTVFLGEEYSTIESDHQTICTNVSSGDDYLIAAAPDCYEELREADRVICELCYIVNPQHAEADYGIGCKSCEDRERRLKALAKAEGK